jgi:hypothetical protein
MKKTQYPKIPVLGDRKNTKVGVLRDSHNFFQRHIGYLNDFLARKRKKNCSRRFEAKKATMPWEPPRGTTTVPERAIVALYYSGFLGK